MNRIIRTTALFVLTALLSACGSSKSGSGNLSSTDTSGGQYALSECNQIPANTSNLSGVLSSFYDQAAQRYRDDLARVKLSTLPTGVISDSTHYLQIFAWRINESSGERIYDRGALGLVFVNKTTGEYLNTFSPITTLSRNSITQIINSYNLSSRGITVNNFFSHMIVLVSGITASDDALTFSLYQTSAGTTAQSSVDALIPAFIANPYTYAQKKPWPLLYSIHPNNGMAQGLPETDYVAATNLFCQGFL